MLAQYTAASLVSENKVLAHPASVDTIPTSGKQEDHVSMGWTAVRKLGTWSPMSGHAWRSRSCARVQGIGMRSTWPRRAAAVAAMHALVRAQVPTMAVDREVPGR